MDLINNQEGKYHRSVLLEEVVNLLNGDGGWYVDGTLGGGGHSRALLEKNPRIKILGIDKDMDALNYAKKVLDKFKDRIVLVKGDFKDISYILKENKIDKISGFLLDLGVSSHHFDDPQRGFSYHNDGPLDMRMDQAQKITAATVVNEKSAKELAEIIFSLGEERWARRIASGIVKERVDKPIERTLELVEIIKRSVPVRVRYEKIHPARKTFQALRIYINKELDGLAEAIESVVNVLEYGGRICIISFHSLEDRIVKTAFKKLAYCQCNKKFPCQCGGPRLKILTNKPTMPSHAEILENPRSRSAKLRAGEKITSSNIDEGSIK